ncbi:hypothetical protein LLV32_000336 [Escherichia coli]|nr:hypothetical protein [Escherichia coli]EKH9548683.1 hypothetical protein [Escherichia coli]EMB0604089.1 hypothetical protein [Escherichia coli]
MKYCGIALIICLCLFMFAFGFVLGGVQWAWGESENNSKVAFWTMLGGWVSGLATLAAVGVSLFTSYYAMMSGKEKVDVVFAPIYTTSTAKKADKLSLQDLANIKVTNLHGVKCTIVNVYMKFGDVKEPLKINNLKQGGKPIPYTLCNISDMWEFAFGMESNPRLRFLLSGLKYEGRPSFKKGHFIIETAMKQYKLKMRKDFLSILQSEYQSIEEESKRNSVKSGWSRYKKLN